MRWDHLISFFIQGTVMREKLEALLAAAIEELGQIATEDALQELRVKYLGKKGELTSVMKALGNLSHEERPLVGQIVNRVKSELESRIDASTVRVREAGRAEKLRLERVD